MQNKTLEQLIDLAMEIHPQFAISFVNMLVKYGFVFA